MTGNRRRVLILCTGNSCRSQMAAGLANHLLADTWEAASAGTDPASAVHPMALRTMAEVGIDISSARPENVCRHLATDWDLVITVCDAAREACPVFPGGVETVHVSFPDPATATGTDVERMAAFRAVRDSIRESLIPILATHATTPRTAGG